MARAVMGPPSPDKTEAGFLRRYQALPGPLKAFIASVNSPVAQPLRNYYKEPNLVDFDTALTVYLTLWTYGAVKHVPTHWQPSYWFIGDDDKAALTHFMSKLCSTADFAHPVARGHLLHRFDRALKCLLEDQATFEQVMVIVRDAVSACEDRSTHAFNQIDAAIRIQEIYDAVAGPQHVTWELTQYGLSLLRLETVRKYATAYCLRNHISDKVEVHLNFELKLKERLQLPIAATSSVYGRKFPVPPAELDAAAHWARHAASDPVSRHAFFAAWEPWLMHQRQLAAQATPYACLNLFDSDFADVNWAELRCTITRELLDGITEPVFIGEGPQTRVYEFADLMIWWIRHGTEPATRQPLPADGLRLILYRFTF